MSISLRSSSSTAQTVVAARGRVTSTAGSHSTRRLVPGARLRAGICSVTRNLAAPPVSSASRLASRASTLARTISSRSVARPSLKVSGSRAWSHLAAPPELAEVEGVVTLGAGVKAEGGVAVGVMKLCSCWNCFSYSPRHLASICCSSLAMASRMGAPSSPAISTSSCAIRQSKGVVGVGSQLETRGQFTRKKWLDPQRMRSPLQSLTVSVTSTPLTQVLAAASGVMKSSALEMERTQCSGWMPRPSSWMSCSLAAPARPTSVRSLR